MASPSKKAGVALAQPRSPVVEMSPAQVSAGVRNMDALATILDPEDSQSPLSKAVAVANAQLPGPIKALVQLTTEQVLLRDKVQSQEEAYSAGMKDRILYQRVGKHLAIEERVTMLAGDVRDGLDKTMRSAQTLQNLEARILNMRKLLRTQDATANVDIYGRPAVPGAAGAANASGKGGKPVVKTSKDLVDEELDGLTGDNPDGMEDCPKCGKMFLQGFLRRHLEECDGTRGGGDEEGDTDSSASDKEDDVGHGEGGHKYDAKDIAARAAALALKRLDMKECPVCVRKFASARIDKHVAICRMKEERKLAKAAAQQKEMAATLDPAVAAALRANAGPPKAPQKVRALAAGPTSIPLLWDAPLFDGGAPILEYEIQYALVEHKKVNRRETKREVVPQPPISTTRWVMGNPVAHRGYALSNLPANAEIVHLKVRAINEKGRGEWSEEVPLLRTLAAVPPSPPLHVTISVDTPPTSTSFSITWEEPLDTGGEKIDFYEVRYNAQVPDFDATNRMRVLSTSPRTASNASEVITIAVPKTLRVPGIQTRATVNGLFGPALYTDVTVVAIGQTGLSSAPAVPVPSVRTLPMTRLEHIQYEIADKKGMDGRADVPIMDANGAMQIVNRLDYIRTLEGELARLEETGQGSDTLVVAGQDGEVVGAAPLLGDPNAKPVVDTNANKDNTGLSDAYLREIEVRRGQFDRKISMLQARVDELSSGSMRLLERRGQLKHVLVQADRRYRVLQAENEQVKDYRGKFIDSGVMHGRNQRFPADTLRGMIAEEMEEVAHALAQGKREMVAVVEEMAAIKAARTKAEDALKERRAAFLSFEREEARKARAAKFAARMSQASVYRCFAAWKHTVTVKHAAKAKMNGFLARWSNMALARGFRRWWQFTLSDRKAEKMAALRARDDMLPGLGSSLLLAAERQRLDASDDATTLLTWLRRVEGQLDAADASLAYRRRIRDPDIGVIMPRGGPAVRAAAAAAAASKAGGMSDVGLVKPLVAMTLPVSASMTADGTVLAAPVPQLRLLDNVDPASAESKVNGVEVANAAEARMAAEIGGDAAFANVVAQAEQKALLDKHGPDAINEEGKLRDDVEAHARGLLARAEAYMRAGEHERCLLALKRAEMVYGWRKDARGLLSTYRLLATLLEMVGRFDLGILHWDRCLQMAKEPEVSDVLAAAEAHEGRGRCLSARQHHDEALTAFERAEDIHESRDDQPAVARVLRLEAHELDMTHRPMKAAELRKKAEEIDSRLGTLITKGIARLLEMENNLVGLGLAGSRLTNLEAVGPAVPLIRQQMRFLETELFKLRAVCASTKNVMDREQLRWDGLEEEAVRAENSASRTMDTRMLTGATQVYEINELRIALRQEQKKVGVLVEEARSAYRSMVTRMANLEEELKGLQEYLDAETRELSRLAHVKRQLRCAAINQANIKTNNVMGTSTGGVPKVAACLEAMTYCYSSLDGSCQASFVGDSERNPMGQPVGHTRVITCVAYYGGIVYTGSQDCTIRAWDVEADRGWGKRTPIEAGLEAEEQALLNEALAIQEEEAARAEANGEEYVRKPLKAQSRDPQEMRRKKAGQLMVLEGHLGTVTCLAADHKIIVSGSADKTAIVWNAKTGELLRRLRGHEYAVSCVALDDMTFATGGADWEVRVWRITKASKRRPAKVVEMARRLKGHSAPVTCVSLQGFELVSGAGNGEVIVWDTDAGVPLRKHQVHALHRPVFCLQFDAVKIVSAGADSRLIFTDIITGEPISTCMRPHGDSHVLTLSFDTERLITIGADRTMRVWAMKGADPVPVVRLHVLKPGERIQVVCKKYGVKLKDVMRWNGLQDVRNFYEGMRIIMAPPPGSEAYEAMAAAEEEERKKAEAARLEAERQQLLTGTAGMSDGGANAEQALLDSILAKAKDSEIAQEALDAAKKGSPPKAKPQTGAGWAGGSSAPSTAARPDAMLGMSMPSTYNTQAAGGRKVAASTNVWAAGGGAAGGSGGPSGAMSIHSSAQASGYATPTHNPLAGVINEDGTAIDPESTVVGAAISLPSEAVLHARAMNRAEPGKVGFINPTPSPFARQASYASVQKVQKQASQGSLQLEGGPSMDGSAGSGSGLHSASGSVVLGGPAGGGRPALPGGGIQRQSSVMSVGSATSAMSAGSGNAGGRMGLGRGATVRDMMAAQGAGQLGAGLEGTKERSVRAMAAAAQTRQPMGGDVAKALARKGLSAQVSAEESHH